MVSEKRVVKILFFIGSLRSGGKERRLMELMTFLNKKGQYKLELVLTMDSIHFPEFYELDIPCHIIKKLYKKNDPTIFYSLYKLCKVVQPDLLHTWGKMQTFYAIPAAIFRKIPLVNSQITSAPPPNSQSMIDKLSDQLIFKFSNVVLANSQAGIDCFQPPQNKSRLIYNGLNFKRFVDLPDINDIKSKYNILTPYTVIMVATISPKKDYDLFFKVALNIQKIRTDISFVGVGPSHENDPKYREIQALTGSHSNLFFLGRTDEVEALVNACDIGVLFSPMGEGLSNTILEYMALGKPVIASNVGGNKEIIKNAQNGYLIDAPCVDKVTELILELIDDKDKSLQFGAISKSMIKSSFTVEKMGKDFEEVYASLLP